MTDTKSIAFSWKLTDLYNQREDNRDVDLISDFFTFPYERSLRFAFVIGNFPEFSLQQDGTIHIALKKSDERKQIDASVKLWIESSKTRQRFGETSAQKHSFNKVGNKFGLKGIHEDDAFWDLFYRHETFNICCEIKDLDPTVLILKPQLFLQNFWSMFEEEYDAIIKIGEKELKISKVFLMAQSSVFKQMFKLCYKEGQTSIVKVDDVSEDTMKALIHWCYAAEVENGCNLEELFKAADKYDINLLMNECTKLMISTLNKTNVFRRLMLASMRNDKQLERGTLSFIDEMSKIDCISCFTSPDWVEFTVKNKEAAKEINKLIQDKLGN